MRNTKICFYVLILCLFICNCSIHKTDYNKAILSNDERNPLVYFGLLSNGEFLYYQTEDGAAAFYSYNSIDGNTTSIGKVDNYYLDTGSAVLLNNRLYFYATISGVNNSLKNVLFNIDISNKKINRNEKDDNSLAGLYIYQLSDSVISLKTERNEDIVTTYLELFNAKNETWTRFGVNEFNEELRTGSALYVMYADGDHAFVIQDIYDQSGICESYFVQYDDSMNEQQRILLQGDVKNFLTNGRGRITEMKVWHDFVYLKNISSSGFLGQIEGTSIIEIKQDNEFITASTLYINDEPLFYTRQGDRYFTLNMESGLLNENQVRAEDEHCFLQVWTANESIAIVVQSAHGPDIQCFGKRKNLSQLMI